MKNEKLNLKQTEKDLIVLINNEKSNWIQIAKLMDKVEKTKAYPISFTRWVNELARKANVPVSLLWARKKAGKAIIEYQERAKQKGIKTPKIDDINASVDNINLASKIAGRNKDVEDELLTKVIDGELKRSDLKEAWAKVKAERKARGLNPTRTNRHEFEEEKTKKASAVDSYMIINELKSANNECWYLEKETSEMPAGNKRKVVYECFGEVAVRPGTSRKARRIDAVIIENKTNIQRKNGDHGITVHGFEIKVSKDDLLGDTKMGEYVNFVDDFWLAIPAELEDIAKKYCLADWGIVVYQQPKSKAKSKEKHQSRLRVVRQADKQKPVLREQLLEEILVKKLTIS